jgi:ADP-ribose pyrophosphatase YjhB (NUDIX family)
MKLLLELRGVDVGLTETESFTLPYNLRKAARAVIFNGKGEIALLFVSRDNYHKLPGGGFEAGEDVITALKRESLEEVGAMVEVTAELGITIEYRKYINQLQISYCFIANVVGDLASPSFDKGELSDGFQLLWVSLDEAISLLSDDKPEVNNGRFIQKRDLLILSEAKKIMAI